MGVNQLLKRFVSKDIYLSRLKSAVLMVVFLSYKFLKKYLSEVLFHLDAKWKNK